MSQDLSGGSIGATAPKPIVESPAVTRGVHGFHAPGEHPYDQEAAAAQAEAAGGGEVVQTATTLHDASDPSSVVEGVVGADGLARATIEKNGAKHELVWDPNESPAAVNPDGGSGDGSGE